MAALEEALDAGIAAFDLPALPAGALSTLAAFIDHLARWNRIYNLTAVRRREDMVARHILDSLAILPWLQGPRLLDVGSGAGLPGIPLAVARPQLQFVLLDSNAKRTRFMRQMQAELALGNVTVVNSRVEDYRPAAPFDCIVSRAFSSIDVMLAKTGRLCAPHGRLLAMKGEYPDAELHTLPAQFTVVEIPRLRVPTLDAERHLVWLAPNPLD